MCQTIFLFFLCSSSYLLVLFLNLPFVYPLNRGNLCLTLLPTSDLHISFNGDDGCTERLATLSTKSSCPGIKIEEISADRSGRSFLIRTSDDVVSYYWSSEKSKLLGDELLLKVRTAVCSNPHWSTFVMESVNAFIL